MKRYGASDLVQEDFVRTNNHLFWEWNSTNPNRQEGLLSRGQMCDLMLATEGLAIRKFVHTNSSQDFHGYLNRNYSGGYIAGFVMTRQPTNHCLAIVEWDGQNVEVMNPSDKGSFKSVTWVDFETNPDADFLAFFR